MNDFVKIATYTIGGAAASYLAIEGIRSIWQKQFENSTKCLNERELAKAKIEHSLSVMIAMPFIVAGISLPLSYMTRKALEASLGK